MHSYILTLLSGMDLQSSFITLLCRATKRNKLIPVNCLVFASSLLQFLCRVGLYCVFVFCITVRQSLWGPQSYVIVLTECVITYRIAARMALLAKHK
jgi:hypothetical protein